MVSVTKAASDTCLNEHQSTSVLQPLNHMSSIKTNNILKNRSGNNISSTKNIHNHGFQNSMESINDIYQRFSSNNIIDAHFPIASIQRDVIVVKERSSSQLPSVPTQAGTFIHRILNKFFSITNTNQKKKETSRSKRTKHEQMNTTTLNTRTMSDDSHTLLNITSKRRKQQRSKLNTNHKHCTVCRKYRNCFSILPKHQLQPFLTDFLDCSTQSPTFLNSNATTILKKHLAIPTESSTPSSKVQLEKNRSLHESQYQTIATAVELIFDTLISNYQHISV